MQRAGNSHDHTQHASRARRGCAPPLAAVASLLLSLSSLPIASAASAADLPMDGQEIVTDKRFHDYLPSPVSIDVLATDLGWAEGPVWVSALGALLFSDVAEDKVYRWDEKSGLAVFLSPSGHDPDDQGHAWRGANGLAVDHQGRLLLAQQSARQLVRMRAPLEAPESSFERLAVSYRGQRINSPNDLVVSRAGEVYFTDPPYGLAGFERSDAIELSFFGVFRLALDGELTPLITDLPKPNGIALSADESTLLVSNSQEEAPSIFTFALAGNATPREPQLFFDARALVPQGAGSTDGLAVHASGTVFASVPGGLALLSATGELLGRLMIGQVTNVAFDECYCTLFLTTPDRLLRLTLRGPD